MKGLKLIKLISLLGGKSENSTKYNFSPLTFSAAVTNSSIKLVKTRFSNN